MKSWLLVLLAVSVASSYALKESPCFADPTQESCKNADSFYTEAMRRSDLDGLCMQMPSMSGCVVRADCQNSDISSSVCEDWGLLHDICSGMMSQMDDCKHFFDLCLRNNKTVVSQCTSTKGINNLISGKDALKLAREMCDKMKMEACSECTKSSCPAPLRALSNLCRSMPHMKECTSWAHMCVSNPGDLGELCGKKTMPDERSCSRAPMNMLFHSNLNDAVLFEGLYACTTPSYLFTWLCIAVVGLLSEFLKSVKIRCITKLAKMQSPSRGTEALQLLLTFGTSIVNYSAMLIAMTFNVGYFFAVVSGLAIGKFFFIERQKIHSGREKDDLLDGLLSDTKRFNSADVHVSEEDFNCCE
jgi:solute carrier family 31 (copper transporter), member 1